METNTNILIRTILGACAIACLGSAPAARAVWWNNARFAH